MIDTMNNTDHDTMKQDNQKKDYQPQEITKKKELFLISNSGNWSSILRKSFFLAVAIIAFSTLMVIIGVIFFANQKLHQFNQYAGTQTSDLISLVYQSWNHQVIQTNQHKNILILGVDSLENRGDIPPLSDSIVIVSLDLDQAKIRSLSLPRDLWSQKYQTKINALLAYGEEKTPTNPTLFPQKTISELTDIPIHHTVVLTLNDLSELIDLVEGVDIFVEESFIDTEFPRDDVDISKETDPDKLYKTVEFKVGLQHMDGKRALEYIRSRKAEGNHGSDIARSARQQAILSAILSKLLEPNILFDAQIMGKLYSFYQQKYESSVSFVELLATVKSLYPQMKTLEIETKQLEIGQDIETASVWHPPLWQYEGLWVYEIHNLEAFKQEIHQKLFSE